MFFGGTILVFGGARFCFDGSFNVSIFFWALAASICFLLLLLDVFWRFFSLMLGGLLFSSVAMSFLIFSNSSLWLSSRVS